MGRPKKPIKELPHHVVIDTVPIRERAHLARPLCSSCGDWAGWHWAAKRGGPQRCHRKGCDCNSYERGTE